MFSIYCYEYSLPHTFPLKKILSHQSILHIEICAYNLDNIIRNHDVDVLSSSIINNHSLQSLDLISCQATDFNGAYFFLLLIHDGLFRRSTINIIDFNLGENAYSPTIEYIDEQAATLKLGHNKFVVQLYNNQIVNPHFSRIEKAIDQAKQNPTAPDKFFITRNFSAAFTSKNPTDELFQKFEEYLCSLHHNYIDAPLELALCAAAIPNDVLFLLGHYLFVVNDV